jgi:hypothetical protein
MRGKVLFLVAFGSLFLLEMLLLALGIALEKQSALTNSLIRFPLTVLLVWLIYRGHRWPRVLMSIFMALAVAVGLWFSLKLALFGVLAAYFAFLFYVLSVSPSVNAFLASQAATRQGHGT